MDWTVLILNKVVEAELEILPEDVRASFARIVTLIEDYGLEKVGMPYVRHIQGKLWEMRMRGGEALRVPCMWLRLIVA